MIYDTLIRKKKSGNLNLCKILFHENCVELFNKKRISLEDFKSQYLIVDQNLDDFEKKHYTDRLNTKYISYQHYINPINGFSVRLKPDDPRREIWKRA